MYSFCILVVRYKSKQASKQTNICWSACSYNDIVIFSIWNYWYDKSDKHLRDVTQVYLNNIFMFYALYIYFIIISVMP